MAYASTSDIKQGFKIKVDGQPYLVTGNEFVKPGKGQAFNRIRLKHILTGRVIEKTFKSGDKFELADVNETEMRLLYTDQDGAIFMDDKTFEQVNMPFDQIGDHRRWLKDDLVFGIIFYNGNPVSIEPPTFIELKITETSPGIRGDTASGRVMKPAILETGAEVQVPIFVNEGEIVRIDTRTGDYDSRVS